jgi:4a-hydroxytetrahydrobiopterin dehydratase
MSSCIMVKLPKKLTASQVTKALKKLPLWAANSKQTEIFRTISFRDFVAALAFIAKVTVHAEIAQHHPEVVLSYGKVKVVLKTDEVDGITVRDTELAAAIDKIAS